MRGTISVVDHESAALPVDVNSLSVRKGAHDRPAAKNIKQAAEGHYVA